MLWAFKRKKALLPAEGRTDLVQKTTSTLVGKDNEGR